LIYHGNDGQSKLWERIQEDLELFNPKGYVAKQFTGIATTRELKRALKGTAKRKAHRYNESAKAIVGRGDIDPDMIALAKQDEYIKQKNAELVAL
jgi:hypothetical protein